MIHTIAKKGGKTSGARLTTTNHIIVSLRGKNTSEEMSVFSEQGCVEGIYRGTIYREV